jgi:glycine/D-amino acid oxidase-like deaminating enzyme
MCYHGNGVAMGSYAGALLAQMIVSRNSELPYPEAMKSPLRRFGLGRLRRALIPLAYSAYALSDF